MYINGHLEFVTSLMESNIYKYPDNIAIESKVPPPTYLL
jgi:hypothetical protein